MDKVQIGIIGGSGLYDMAEVTDPAAVHAAVNGAWDAALDAAPARAAA